MNRTNRTNRTSTRTNCFKSNRTNSNPYKMVNCSNIVIIMGGMAFETLQKEGRIRYMEKEDDNVEAKDAEDAEDIGAGGGGGGAGGGDDEGYITIKQIEHADHPRIPRWGLNFLY